jgi:hypothetical protein
MLDSTEAERLARFLTERLPPDLLTQVIGRLIDQPAPAPSPQPPRKQRFRKKDFKLYLGGIGDTKWAQLRAEGVIPEGTKLSSHLELWTEEQMLQTVMLLAEREAARQEDARKEAEANAVAEGVPAPRLVRLKPVPAAKR